MLLGTTYAWFTDSAASASNVITAGNLDIEVTYTLDGVTWNNLDGANDLFQKGLWEPGHTEVVVLKIENKGTLALKYSADINVVDEKVGKTKDNKDIVLSKILTVSTCTQQAIDANGAANSNGAIFPGMAFNQPEGWIGYQTTNTFENGKKSTVKITIDLTATEWNKAIDEAYEKMIKAKEAYDTAVEAYEEAKKNALIKN
jgi:predicted ribosomally synthesized peptide with SipW-like signal peptide